MKVQHLILALTVLAVVATSCEEKQVMPGDNDHNQASLVIPDPTPDPEGFKVPEGTINVYKAVEIAKSLKFGEVSKDRYLIKGYVISFNHNESFKTDFPVYGNEMFYISAVAPTEEIQPLNNFYAYRALGRYGAKLPDLDCIKEGDFVVISCYITNYNGVFESSGACFVSASNNEHFNATFPEVTAPTTKGDELSVTEAEAYAHTVEDGKTSTDYKYVRGIVSSIDLSKSTIDEVTGAVDFITFNITDGNTYGTAFKTYYKADDHPFTSVDQVAVGDEVVVYARIQNYGGICEPVYGYVKESNNPNF
ncbi:MAG: hypothetical protein IJQ95_03330 [Paludibacteraceae bacterium]|nr:hypothetical protein [Paludibacteraceae bacterium]